ncbi:MAG: hypothetical protein ACJ8BW_05100 [Ktedonobacteraceae bacterium]
MGRRKTVVAVDCAARGLHNLQPPQKKDLRSAAGAEQSSEEENLKSNEGKAMKGRHLWQI